MRTVIVAAVSTPGQATDEKYSIPQQLIACRDTCQARGWSVVADVTIPGHSRNYNWLDELCGDCPEYAQVLKLIRSGQVDLVIVRDYDRLWRTDALRAQVMAVCREHRVQVFSLNQPVEPVPVDLLDMHDTAKLSEVLYGFISEQENRTRVRRWAVGMEGRFRRGLHSIISVIPYGYRRNPDKAGPILVDLEQACWVRQIYEWALEGVSYLGIARRLNDLGVPASRGGLWRYCSVQIILSNPTYCGRVRWEGKVGPGRHEPLVSEEMYEQVQALLAGRSFTRGPLHSPLSGLLRCGFCGSPMSFCRKGRDWFARCNKYANSGGRECHSNMHKEEKVFAAVVADVRRVLKNPAAWQAVREDSHSEAKIVECEAQIRDYETRWGRWERLYEVGGIGAEEFLRHRQEILGQVERARSRLEALRAEVRLHESRQVQYAELAAVVDELDQLGTEELRRAFGMLIQRVVLIKGEPVRVEWWS